MLDPELIALHGVRPPRARKNVVMLLLFVLATLCSRVVWSFVEPVDSGITSFGGSPELGLNKDKTSSGYQLLDKLDRGRLVQEWDQHMQGFVPELLLTFPLPARTDEFFFEEVTPPAFIRGGFFATSAEETSSVDFHITDPSGDVVIDKYGEADGLFHFTARKNGTYTFIVSNHKWMEKKTVTFAIGKGTGAPLHAGHLNDLESYTQVIERKLREIQTESTYLWIRQNAHMKTVESVHRRVFWFCFLQLIVLLSMSCFQVFYIKGLMSNRTVL